MTTLLFASKLSDLLIEEFIRIYQKDDCIAFSDNPDIVKQLSDIGIECQYLTLERKHDWVEHDSKFKELAMPGIFGDAKFGGTNLPIYEVLSLDRLYFWYNGNNEKLIDIIKGLNADKAYVSLDLHSTISMAIGYLIPDCTAIKTEQIVISHYYDALPYLPFNKFIVNSGGDEKLIKNRKEKAQITGKPRRMDKKTAVYQKREGLRKGYGATESDVLVTILFDKKYEWQTRKFLTDSNIKGNIFICPTDSRSSELAPILFDLPVVDKSFIPASDMLVIFDWVEDVDKYGCKRVELFDYKNKGLVKKIQGIISK